MNSWLLRFSLGLPARPIDREQMMADIPEVFEDEATPPPVNLSHFWIYLGFPEQDLFDRLRRWAAPETRVPRGSGMQKKCPLPNCPLRASDLGASDASPLPLEDQSDTSTETSPLEYVQFPGGIIGSHLHPSTKSFTHLAKKMVSRFKGTLSRVYLTDPYLFADGGELGEPGGLALSAEFLESVCSQPGAGSVEIFVTPSPRAGNRDDFWAAVRPKLPTGSEIRSHSQPKNGGRFHDRFILFVSAHNEMALLVGPSLNSLQSGSIFYAAEIEDQTALKHIAGLVGA